MKETEKMKRCAYVRDAAIFEKCLGLKIRIDGGCTSVQT